MSVTTGLWPRLYTRLSAISAFTYRDGLTYSEYLELLREKVEELIAYSIEVKLAMTELVADIEQMRIDLKSDMDKRDAALRSEAAKTRKELLDLIEKVTVGGSSYDPTDGTAHKSVSEVMDNVYTYLRTSARFADQIDSDGLTAAQWDARGMTARRFDLDPEVHTTHATHV